MTTVSNAQRSFAAGEVSPLLYRREDYLRHQTGLRICRGFVPLRQGGFTRTPGTWYRGRTLGDTAGRLVPFRFSAADACVLEFTPLKMRVWRYGTLVESSGSPYELTTPFTADDIAGMSWVQSADVIYIATGNRPVQVLSRFALDNWTITDLSLSTGPFRVQNLDESLTIQASAATGTVTLTASTSLFNSGWVGTLLRLEPTDYATPLWTSNTTVSVGQKMRNDGKTYELTVLSGGTTTGEVAPQHEEGEHRVSLSPDIRWRYLDDGIGVVRITAVASGTSATATVLRRLPQDVVSEATYRWAEGAWGTRHGWPATVAIDDQRLIAAATPAEPRTIWFSAVGDFADFAPSAEADGAFAYAIDGTGTLRHLVPGRTGLHVLGAGEEFSALTTDSSVAIGPTTARFVPDSQIGASDARPIAPNGSPIFISADRGRVFEISYDLQSDANVPRELSLPAEHLGAARLEEIAWQSQPLRLAWLRRGNGDLAAMVHDPSEDVLGWATQGLAGGIVESFCVTPNANGTADLLTLIVQRTIGGTSVRMVEEMAQFYGVLSGAQPIADANHAFAALAFAPAEPTQAFDLPHLAGETVYAWTDEGQFGPLQVAGDGTVTLPAAVASAIIGLVDDSAEAETLPFRSAARDGDTFGRQQRIQGFVAIALHRSAAGYVAAVARDLGKTDWVGDRQRLIDRPVAAALTDGLTGIARVNLSSPAVTEVSVRITPEGLAPLTVTAISPPVDQRGL